MYRVNGSTPRDIHIGRGVPKDLSDSARSSEGGMMPTKNSGSTNALIDWIRPSDVDGPLVGAVLSTYGLSLDQPDFFGQDFLPTLLGLGGVRDRGYSSP